MDVIAWERDVQLIGELCGELARHDVKVRLTDACPALYVRCPDGELERVEVRDGECFAWADGRHQHITTDPKGAASRIAAFVRQAAPADPARQACHRPIGEPSTPGASGVVQVIHDPAELIKRVVNACQDAGLEAVVLAPTRVRVNVLAGTSRTAEIITLKPDADEVACWWWSWNEPICPAADIDHAVAAIAHVVSVLEP